MKTVLLVVVQVMWLANAADDASPKKDVETIEPKDRSLYVRNIPGIFGHRSSVFGVQIHPYQFVSTVLETRYSGR